MPPREAEAGLNDFFVTPLLNCTLVFLRKLLRFRVEQFLQCGEPDSRVVVISLPTFFIE